jgi:putative hydrolase of the HAD superfamily
LTPLFDVIAFDADDTLWRNEELYAQAHARFATLLAPYWDGEIAPTLDRIETNNLGHYGYGIKGFILSLIETAIELSQGRVPGQVIQDVIDLGRHMLDAPVQLLDHAQETLASLAASYPLMLITKGDLLDQESKIARSGLEPYFRHIEIISDKTASRYSALLARHRLQPARFLMVGNSLRSDILPVVSLGSYAVHIPYHLTWTHEHIQPTPQQCRRYFQLEHLGLLPALIERLPLQGA